MDDLEHSRPEMLWILKVFLKNGKGRPMFPASPLKLKEYNFRYKLLAELEHLNLTVSGHFLTLFKSPVEVTQAIKLPHFIGCSVTLTGCIVTTKQTLTQSNRPMKFMTLEDSTALFDAILFPVVYKQFGPLLFDRGPYIIKGRVKKEGRSISITVSWLSRLHPSEAATNLAFTKI
jgi:error-prone DNA polymerase